MKEKETKFQMLYDSADSIGWSFKCMVKPKFEGNIKERPYECLIR